MPEIALHPFHQTTRVKLTVEINHELAQDLERYRAFYKQAYGADVSESDLLREMARRFMDGDREFQVAKYGLKARSRTPRQPAAPSVAAPKEQP
ncbi:MAG: DUF2274 domain-containing protein [Planctomycetota bacterium]|nr:DUF2274 domain-containing protein [Planctomycetota bacterium]